VGFNACAAYLQRAGIRVKDWVLAINGVDVRYKSHDEVVAMVKECREEVTLEVTTPSEATSPPQATSPT
jgi:C-terminal processing protease CtpA/Prc